VTSNGVEALIAPDAETSSSPHPPLRSEQPKTTRFTRARTSAPRTSGRARGLRTQWRPRAPSLQLAKPPRELASISACAVGSAERLGRVAPAPDFFRRGRRRLRMRRAPPGRRSEVRLRERCPHKARSSSSPACLPSPSCAPGARLRHALWALERYPARDYTARIPPPEKGGRARAYAFIGPQHALQDRADAHFLGCPSQNGESMRWLAVFPALAGYLESAWQGACSSKDIVAERALGRNAARAQGGFSGRRCAIRSRGGASKPRKRTLINVTSKCGLTAMANLGIVLDGP